MDVRKAIWMGHVESREVLWYGKGKAILFWEPEANPWIKWEAQQSLPRCGAQSRNRTPEVREECTTNTPPMIEPFFQKYMFLLPQMKTYVGPLSRLLVRNKQIKLAFFLLVAENCNKRLGIPETQRHWQRYFSRTLSGLIYIVKKWSVWLGKRKVGLHIWIKSSWSVFLSAFPVVVLLFSTSLYASLLCHSILPIWVWRKWKCSLHPILLWLMLPQYNPLLLNAKYFNIKRVLRCNTSNTSPLSA